MVASRPYKTACSVFCKPSQSVITRTLASCTGFGPAPVAVAASGTSVFRPAGTARSFRCRVFSPVDRANSTHWRSRAGRASPDFTETETASKAGFSILQGQPETHHATLFGIAIGVDEFRVFGNRPPRICTYSQRLPLASTEVAMDHTTPDPAYDSSSLP